MRNNQLFINGKKVKHEPLDQKDTDGLFRDGNASQFYFVEDLSGRKHPVTVTPKCRSFCSFGPVSVPKGQYFVMGDNRGNSADSRYFGFVERYRIIGQATAIVASFDKKNNYWPRWERFFTRLP